MTSSGHGIADAKGMSWKGQDIKESRRLYNENYDRIFNKKEKIENDSAEGIHSEEKTY